MQNFEYNANPARVLFGSGTVQKLPDEVKRLNSAAPLILCTPRGVTEAKQLESILAGTIAGMFAEATMHTPVHVTEKALMYARECNADSGLSIPATYQSDYSTS
jgi:alcohol dehydrogenase class IV